MEEVFKADGVSASKTDLSEDAKLWAAHFANDVFNNHVSNHEHDCTETCVKYAKKKVEAKLQLRSHKVPSCRFWYFHVVRINRKRKRRRGKPLVKTLFFATDDERRQQFRCQVCREQPFRSTSNDVAQVCDRCNVDFQFLCCAPESPRESGSAAEGSGGAAASNVSPDQDVDAPGPPDVRPPTRRRACKKAPPLSGVRAPPVQKRTKVPRSDHAAWFSGFGARTQAFGARWKSLQPTLL